MELHPSERLIWRGHPAARAYVGWYAKWGALAIVPWLVVTVMRSQDRGIGMAYWKWVALTVLLLACLVAIDVVRRATIDYVVTDQRIRIRRGTLSRREQSTSIEKIQNINTFQGVLDRMLGIGDVEFGTAGSEVADASLRFAGIARPHELVTRMEGRRSRGEETSAT